MLKKKQQKFMHEQIENNNYRSKFKQQRKACSNESDLPIRFLELLFIPRRGVLYSFSQQTLLLHSSSVPSLVPLL